MTLWLLGLNHQTAPVDLRERVAFGPQTLPAALASLRALPQVAEAALLSTCNRTELYAAGSVCGPNATRSRRSTGAVWWFSPRTHNVIVQVLAVSCWLVRAAILKPT